MIDRDGEGPPLRRPDGRPPGDDLRATPFTDDVFSEYHARRKSSGRGYGLIVGIVIGLAAIGGIGWYMWDSGLLTMTGGVPQLVKADPEPYKVKPENPGGMQVDNQDKLVYDRVAKGEAPPRVENLLPAPEEPKAPPRAEVVKPAAEAAKPATEALTPEPAKAEALPAIQPAAPPVPVPAPVAAAKVPPPPPAKSVDTPESLAAAVAAVTKPAEAPPAPASVPVEVAKAVAPVPSPVAASTSGGFQVQIASARSEEGALAEWKRISAKHKDLLGGLTPAVAKADLGEKGVFFRLRAGPLSDKAAADTLCAALAAQNLGCLPVPP
jgi:hypothetical protein